MELSIIERKIEEIAGTGINGCVTGSCLLAYDSPVPVEMWETETDIDVFTYTHAAWISAVEKLLSGGYSFGPVGASDRVAKRNQVKWSRQLHDINSKGWLHTIEVNAGDGITVNLSFKKDKNDILNVLGSFDTTAVMQGIDIPSGKKIDLREVVGRDKHVAEPNPIRWTSIIEDASTWRATMMMRQWDRVIKLNGRGIDTMPLAYAYKKMLEELIEMGSLFDGEESIARFELFDSVYGPTLRDKIIPWIEANRHGETDEAE